MSFVESLMRAAILAQAATTDPATVDPNDNPSVVDLPVDHVTETGPSPLILWSWVGAQLAFGFLGYYIVKVDINDPMDAAEAAYISGGGS